LSDAGTVPLVVSWSRHIAPLQWSGAPREGEQFHAPHFSDGRRGLIEVFGLTASPAWAADDGMSEPDGMMADETINTESLDDEDETISTDSMESGSMPEDQIPEDDKIDE
jgi:hypothetical protein